MNDIVPIAKIAAYKNGDALTSVSGMLGNVWDRKTGVKNGKPWSIQNLFLKDQTGSIKVTLFGRKECPKSMEGKQVTLSAVTVDDNTYNGKTTRTVKVTEDSGVKELDSGEKANPGPGAEPRAGSGTKLVLGQTVGMSINKTIDIFISLKKDDEYYAGDQFIYDLHAIAGSIIHVSQALEAGRQLEAPKSQEVKKEPEQAGPPDDNFLQEGNDDIPF